MTKNIEWLKEEIGELPCVDTVFISDGLSYMDSAVPVLAVYDLINQLDEPEVSQLDKKIRELESYNNELIRDNNQLRNAIDNQEVLSQEWISEKSIDTHVDTVNREIQVTFILDDLKELLVPKQELPVIPKFVAEFLIGKEDYMLYELFENEWLYEEHDRVAKWLYDNDELTNKQREINLVMARDRGYTVEEEQKYRVIDSHKIYLLAKEEDRNEVETVAKFVEIYGYDHAELDYNLTEQEIKDYDERYWAFRKPVEELEE